MILLSKLSTLLILAVPGGYPADWTIFEDKNNAKISQNIAEVFLGGDVYNMQAYFGLPC